MEVVGHEGRCEEHIDGTVKSVGELVKTFMENKAIEGIFSVCTILGKCYCPRKDRELKKFAKSKTIAVHGKYHEKMPWNGIMWSCLYRNTVILAVLT